jgi:hypothetical protein
MNRFVALIAFATLAAAGLPAQEQAAFRLSGQVGAEAAWHGPNEASALYGVAPFDRMTAAGLIEAKAAFSRQYTTLGLLDFTFRDAGLLAHSGGGALESLSFTVNELYADVNFEDLLFLRLGKQRLKWGAGFVFNPSDPVNPPKDPIASRAVREGVTALKAELIAPVVSLMGFGVAYDALEETGLGARLSTSAVANTDLAVCGYWSASESWTAALNASVAPLYEVPGWDTLQLWFEGCFYGQARYAAYTGGALPGAAALGTDDGRQYSLLVGASARLPVVRTQAMAEYYHLSEGLSSGELAAVFRGLGSADPAVAGESAGWLAEIGRRPGRLAADYLFVSLTQPSVTESGHPVLDKVGFAAACLLSLTDRSFYATGKITTGFVEDSSVDLSVSWAHGGADSEFGNTPTALSAALEMKVYF